MMFCRFDRTRAHMHPRWSPSHPQERGSAAVELVVLVPALLVLVLFVVFVGRLAQANTTVRHAADQAARAASQVSEGAMSSTATRTAMAELSANGVSCVSPAVRVATTDTPGASTVAVTVSCTINRQALAPLAPGVHHVVATSTEVIDVYRGDGLP